MTWSVPPKCRHLCFGLLDRHDPIATVGLALLAHADGARGPGVLASIVVAALVLAGGPSLMASLRRLVERHRDAVHERCPVRRAHPSQHPPCPIVALMASTDWVDFSFVRDRLGLSDSALSKQFLHPGGCRLRDDRPTCDQSEASGSSQSHRRGPNRLRRSRGCVAVVIASAESVAR